jgi:hypothetical protein
VYAAYNIKAERDLFCKRLDKHTLVVISNFYFIIARTYHSYAVGSPETLGFVSGGSVGSDCRAPT